MCARVARECGVSPGFVRQIVYGYVGVKSTGLRVEKALLSAGAPFMEERISEVEVA